MSGPANVKAEQAVIGALLVAPSVKRVRSLTIDHGLSPDLFTHPGYRQIAQAMIDLADQDTTPTEVAIADRAGNVDGIDGLINDALMVASMDPIAEQRVLVALAARRRQWEAGELLRRAAETGDQSLAVDAEALLTRNQPVNRQATMSPEQLRDWYYDHFQTKVEAFPWRFFKLTDWTGGGLRRGQYVLVGGWGGHGKSSYVDPELHHFANQGLGVHLYINEMTRAVRMDRWISRLSGIPFKRLYKRQLHPGEGDLVLKATNQICVGITECAGWTAEEICRHIRFNGWDIACVDILHEIPHTQANAERSVAHNSHALRAVSLETGTAVIATVHLNNARAIGVKHPVPVDRDIRDSSMPHRQADTVLFVHRDEDDDGLPGDQGVLVASKVRDGEPQVMHVQFDWKQMQFNETGLVSSGTGAF